MMMEEKERERQKEERKRRAEEEDQAMAGLEEYLRWREEERKRKEVGGVAPVLVRANPTSTPSTLQPPGKDEDEDVYIFCKSDEDEDEYIL